MTVINPRVMQALLMQDPQGPGGLPVGLFADGPMLVDEVGGPARVVAADGSLMGPRATARALGGNGLHQSEAEASRMAAALASPSVSLASNYAPGPAAFNAADAATGLLPKSYPVEVAAPVAQAVQRNSSRQGGMAPPPRRGPTATNTPPAVAAPPAPGGTPAESAPAAQVAEATEKAKWDWWQNPDGRIIQDFAMKQGWNQDDALIAARVGTGALATVVGVPLLAAAVNELSGR